MVAGRYLKRNEGDTLVEVAIAIAIMSVLLVTAYNIGNMTFRVGAQARERTQAIYMAQQQAEKLRLVRDEALIDDGVLATDGISLSTYLNTVCAGQCYFPANSVAPVHCADAAHCLEVGPFPYNVVIKNKGSNPAGTRTDFDIEVSWPSGVADEDNVSTIQLTLVDKRIVPRTCEVVGDTSCTD